MRAVWFTFGWACVGLALVGVALPLLPTVPFLLLAAFAFARASPAAHDWLTRHPRLGPPIAAWRRHGAIGPRAKRLALASIGASFLGTLAFGAPAWALGAQAATLCAVAAFILTRPDGPAGEA